MYLFILESIGMQELVLIGAIALIVFGPRKLPQMMKMAGKMMAEFRKATTDFKETWEREVDFEDFKETNQIKPVTVSENTIANETVKNRIEITAPEIKEIKQEDFERSFPAAENREESAAADTAKVASGKQDWL